MKRRTLLTATALVPIVAACSPTPGATSQGTSTGAAENSLIPRNSELLSDERVRKAIAYALDMSSVISGIYKGKAKPANALMPAGPYKPSSGLTDYNYNMDKAKQLLKDAGWDSNRELDLVYYYSDQSTTDFMAAVQQFLGQVGIKAKPRLLVGDLASQLWTHPKDPVNGPSAVKWDIAYGAIAALSPHEYYDRFLPTYTANSLWPDNKEYTGLIQATEASPDPTVQKAAFQKVVTWENAHLPEVPLYYQPIFITESKKLDRKGAEYGNEQFNYDWQINKWDLPVGTDGKKTLHTNGGPVQFFEHPFYNPGLMMGKRILWDHLIVASGDLRPKAGQLAEKYELSPDGKKVTFTLRKNIKWHDGTSITGDDVKFTYELAAKVPTIHSVFAATLKKISSITVNGDVVEFNFSEVDSDALITFSQLPPLPKKYLATADPLKIQQDPYFQKPIGSGPFRLTDVSMGSYAVAEAWPDYWNGRPVIDQLNMYASGESDPNLVKNVQAGNVDYAFTKSVDDVVAIAAVNSMSVHDVDVYYTRLLFINSFPR